MIVKWISLVKPFIEIRKLRLPITTQTQEMHQRSKITTKTEYEQTVFDEM